MCLLFISLQYEVVLITTVLLLLAQFRVYYLFQNRVHYSYHLFRPLGRVLITAILLLLAQFRVHYLYVYIIYFISK